MIKDLLVSFRDNFKEKTTNPFLGTYLIVWLVRNWELLYTLFNFNSDQKLNDKVEFIKNYYIKHDFLENLVTNIYWAFGILCITYLLLNLSRLIVNLSEKRLTPWIYKITDSKSIVLRTEYERIREEREDLQLRLDHERESKSKLESRIKYLENEILEVSKAQSEKLVDKSPDIESDNMSNDVTDEIDKLLQKLKVNNFVKDFKDIAVRINKGEYISNKNNSIDYLIELGLIRYEKDHIQGASKKYILTADGEKILRKTRVEE